ncbi:hypothetical protein [Delftia sp. RIT313]|uniref:hypothetical protein n=1 Tax=Delftia sp. RIT313 TaxID=1468410 RepID=UPI00044A2D89|nr:hypothetical protein [Delftia sp. RIT313]EZP51444.1 hypothetical protein BW39_03913 [Delftia sp. RIT313]
MTAIQRFAIHGTIMNPHSSGPYVRHEDHLAAMQGRCLAQIEEPAAPAAVAGPALEAPAAPARIVADALIRLDAIYREQAEADCDEPPRRPDWLTTALHLAAAAPQAPAAPGMAVTGLAGEIIAALELDEKDGGYDLTSGLFGPKFSALVRRWAAAEWAHITAPQAPAGPSVNERAAYIEFLTGKFPRSYGKEEAGRWWDQGHVSALTWQAARAVAAAPAAPDDVLCYIRPGATLPERHGFEVCRATDAGAMAVMGDGRAHAMPTVTPAEFAADIDQMLAAPAAPSVLPSGWVPCILTHDGQHPEEVAYGPQIMMDRLKKWLGRYFELLAQKVLAEPVQAEMQAALQAVAMDVVHVGAGENTITDAARAKVEAVLEKIGAPWPLMPAAPAAPAVDATAERDAAFEAVRQRLCRIPRWSFHIDSRGNIRRVDDASGNWIEFSVAHQLFDPVAVDSAIAAQAAAKGTGDAA